MENLNTENFKDPSFVSGHALETLEFYLPNCVDEERGGYFGGYLDDGTVYNQETKDLIGTTRFIIDFALANQLHGSKKYIPYLDHGLDFLLDIHKDKKFGGYYQTVEGRQPRVEKNKLTYSHAFVILALSTALNAGVEKTQTYIKETFDLLENRLWEDGKNLYAAEATKDFSKILPYRGQNCNMHMVEALITAYEATDEDKYLNKAFQIAYSVVRGLARQCDGLIWEHYTTNWEVDPEYNRDDPENIYRPFGFLPGHFMEWSKLLLILERHKPKLWQKDTALWLFGKAIEFGWNPDLGGFNYTFDANGEVLNRDRYYWVHAEAIAAAYLLWNRTGDHDYLNWYNTFWQYAMNNLVDRENGGWYRVVNEKGQPYNNKKSIPGKTDYHVINACYEIYRTAETTKAVS